MPGVLSGDDLAIQNPFQMGQPATGPVVVPGKSRRLPSTLWPVWCSAGARATCAAKQIKPLPSRWRGVAIGHIRRSARQQVRHPMLGFPSAGANSLAIQAWFPTNRMTGGRESDHFIE
jgi:hypothetical protein